MEFSIIQHINNIEKHLINFSSEKSKLFASFCLKKIREKYLLPTKFRYCNNFFNEMEQIFNHLKNVLLERVDLDERLVYETKNKLQSFEWRDDEMFSQEHELAYYMEQYCDTLYLCLKVFKGEAAYFSARCAENVVNCIDYELSMEFGHSISSQIFSDPRMIAEIESHRRILEIFQQYQTVQELLTDHPLL